MPKKSDGNADPVVTPVAPVVGGTMPAGEPQQQGGLNQEALDALFAQRAARGAKSRETEILKDVGFDSVEALKSYVETSRTEMTTVKEERDTLNGQLVEMKDSQRKSAITTSVTKALGKSKFYEASYEDVESMFTNGDLPEGVTFNEETSELTGVEEFLVKLEETKPHWVDKTDVRMLTPSSPLNPNLPESPDQRPVAPRTTVRM